MPRARGISVPQSDMSPFQPPSDVLLHVTGWKAESIARALGKLINNARHRAKVKKVPFSLTYQDLEAVYVAQNGLCFYSNREMDVFPTDGRRRGRLTMSLDRLNPRLGYVASNVCLCCCDVNLAKGECTYSEFREMCIAVTDYFPKF